MSGMKTFRAPCGAAGLYDQNTVIETYCGAAGDATVNCNGYHEQSRCEYMGILDSMPKASFGKPFAAWKKPRKRRLCMQPPRNRRARSLHDNYGHKTQDRNVSTNNSTADAVFALVMAVLFFGLPYICAKVVGAI